MTIQLFIEEVILSRRRLCGSVRRRFGSHARYGFAFSGAANTLSQALIGLRKTSPAPVWTAWSVACEFRPSLTKTTQAPRSAASSQHPPMTDRMLRTCQQRPQTSRRPLQNKGSRRCQLLWGVRETSDMTDRYTPSECKVSTALRSAASTFGSLEYRWAASINTRPASPSEEM